MGHRHLMATVAITGATGFVADAAGLLPFVGVGS